MFQKLRDKILARQDIPFEIVKIKEWDVELKVQGLTGKDRSELFKAVTNENGDVDSDKLYYMLIITCTRDPQTGEQIFTSEDIDELKGKNSEALEALAGAATKLTGLGEAQIEEAEKNSGAGTPS